MRFQSVLPNPPLYINPNRCSELDLYQQYVRGLLLPHGLANRESCQIKQVLLFLFVLFRFVIFRSTWFEETRATQGQAWPLATGCRASEI